ncbi:MAG: VCBS domain-containing protein [Mycobacterium sp.]|nr:VCBS domain-containing protein [Mycobacterium sp.]
MALSAKECRGGLLWSFGLALGLATAALATGDPGVAWAEPTQTADSGASDRAEPAARARLTRSARTPPSLAGLAAHGNLSAPKASATSAPPGPMSAAAESPLSWAALSTLRQGRGRTAETTAPTAARSADRKLSRSPVFSRTVLELPDSTTGSVRGSVFATGPRLTYRATTSTLGTVSITRKGVFTYTPTATAMHAAAGPGGSATTDTVTITVRGLWGGTSTTTVTVPISPRNSAPTAVVSVGSPDALTGVVTGAVNATDADHDPLTYSTPDTTAKGSVILSAAGSFTYTPTTAARDDAAAPNATPAERQDTFTVTVDDAHGGTAAVAVTVAIRPSSTPPPTEPPTDPPTDPPTGPPPTDPPTEPPTDPGSTGRMAVGINLENVVDWSPAWTFTDAFKASRPWISQTFNPQTWAVTWDDSLAPTLDLDTDGNVTSLKTWTQNGVAMKQYAGTLMFRGLGGDYAGGTYHAEWDGTGVVTFGFDAVVTSSGKTAEGRNFAELAVSPTDNGIYMRIEETDPTDPVRDFNVWMPDYNGQSFRGQRWEPGASFSPFHPLFLARLAPFTALRFMGMQETNTSDIVTWEQRRDSSDIRQGSGSEGTPSEPVVNGMSVEYMVQLANELNADPWFNMPYQADDNFVRNFATYVTQNLEPGRTVYVEWANEVWNFGWGFEASQWVADKAKAAGLDPDYGQWIVAGQEAKRDMDIWSQVFADQSNLDLVRVAAGWAAVDWVTNQVLENMGGSFDAIAIAPYITPTDAQRAGYTSSTTVDKVIADTRTNVATSVQWTNNHELLAQQWSARLGRPIDLVAYEGGPHLDGRGAVYQNAFYAATNDARMGDVYGDYLRALDAAGLDLFMDFQFTGQAGAAPWGDFAKLHRMDESLATAYRYNAVVSAANGSLWSA